ncbi:probable serine/threonine-protein kinase mps1 isoform X2 [Atheta coriaria]|uniref:probable serine/threonine-protein kinase mps1 isoform X2 n=1 Tax=Dalotia coriaria TaxID=877792 RepID=UPI0031F36417
MESGDGKLPENFFNFQEYLLEMNKKYEELREKQRRDNEALKAKEKLAALEEDEVDTVNSPQDLQDDSGYLGDKTSNNKENENKFNHTANSKIKTSIVPSLSVTKHNPKNNESTQVRFDVQKKENFNLERQKSPKLTDTSQKGKQLITSKKSPVEQLHSQTKSTQNQNEFVTPCRPLRPPKVTYSLPIMSSTTNTDSTQKQQQRIMCTVDMRSHAMLQMPIKKPSARKHLLSTSSLASVLEFDDKYEVDVEKPKPLSERLIKDVFQCIRVKEVDYIVLNELGKGGSSVVYHCYDPASKAEYAVKVVDLKLDRNEANGFINEVKALKRLQDCDRIIKLHEHEIVSGENILYMVLEKGGRDFAQILREHSRNVAHLPAFMVHFYWMQMLHAVGQMHSKGVIHSDLKPANFIEIRERLKLIDFGISSCVQLDMTSVVKTVALGTFGYISPEALCADRGYEGSPAQPTYKVGFKSDVWSLGSILYQLVYKRTPFSHIQHSSAKLAAIMDPGHVINYPKADWVPEGVIRCIKDCLQYNARRRPTVADLINAEKA